MRGNINPTEFSKRIDTSSLVKQSISIMEAAFTELGLKGGNICENVCLAFSGGKDSIVVAYLAKKYFGIDKGLCEQSFCFPKDKEDYRDLATSLGLDITFSEILSDTWLQQNSQYIFPPQELGSKFYLLRQQTATKEYSEGNNKFGLKFKAIVTGRRNQENAVRNDYYMRKNGIMQIHPLRYWRTEEIWSFILEKKIPYPSIYTTELGLAEGATPWCNINVKKAGGRSSCWRIVYLHDKEYFTQHIAKHYDEAKEWLRLEQQGK